MIRIKLLFSVLVLLILALPVYASFSPTYGLCTSTENVFFSCETSKRKWISLCGKLPWTLQYRVGTSDHIELRYPKNIDKSINHFLYADYMRFQTNRIEVVFEDEKVAYAIFDYYEDNEHHAGVRVVTSNGKEKEIICARKITSQLKELKSTLHCDSDNALNTGNCP